MVTSWNELPFCEVVGDELAEMCRDDNLEYNVYSSMCYNPFESVGNFDATPINPDSIVNSDVKQRILHCPYMDVEEYKKRCRNPEIGSNLLSMFLNIRSLQNNFSEFQYMFEASAIPLDFICLCETWLCDNPKQLYCMQNYNLYCSCRGARGGGVAIYALKCYNAQVVNNLTVLRGHIETLFLKIEIRKHVWIVGCVYRPPGGNIDMYLDEMSSLLEYFQRTHPNAHILVSGDYNINLLKRDRASSDWTALMSSYNLLPLVTRPTRVTGSSATLIDNIFTNKYNMLSDVGVIQANISDHFAVFSSLSMQGTEKIEYFEITKLNVSESNLSALSRELALFNWNALKSIEDVNELYDSFSENVVSLYDECCPVVKIKVKRLDKEKPYVNRYIKNLIVQKHRLERLYHKKPITYGSRFREIRNKVNREMRAAKELYYKGKINASSSSKDTWNIVNRLLGRNANADLPSEFCVNNESISDHQKIANEFNLYFSTLGDHLAEKFVNSENYLRYLSDEPGPSFSFELATEAEVRSVILSLRNAAPGIDGLPMSIFKDNIDVLLSIITHICNASLKKGIFPENLAVAIITCLYKAGDSQLLQNYRAISLLVAFSKILEKLVYGRLIGHFFLVYCILFMPMIL